MLKLTSLTVAYILAIASNAQSSASAQEPEYACYMRTPSQVIDLSNSLCRPRQPVVMPVASTDELFLAAYKQAAIAKYPNMQDVLLQQPPEINIKYARAVCNGLKAGLSVQQIQSLQTKQINTINQLQPQQNSGVVDLSAIGLLAPKYYCPQFK